MRNNRDPGNAGGEILRETCSKSRSSLELKGVFGSCILHYTKMYDGVLKLLFNTQKNILRHKNRNLFSGKSREIIWNILRF